MSNIASYCFRSPAGLVHDGDPLGRRTTCGLKVGRTWKILDNPQPLTCTRCLSKRQQQAATRETFGVSRV